MVHRDVVSWNAMIMGYASMELGEPAMELYARMQHEGFKPNSCTFIAALKACICLAAREEGRAIDGGILKTRSLEQGRAIHAQVLENRFDSDMLVASTLVDMYAKCGSIVDAFEVFAKMAHRDVVSWNIMIMGYAQMEMGELALKLYNRMQHDGFTPDAWTFVAALKACDSLTLHGCKTPDSRVLNLMRLEQGRAIHAQAAKNGFESNIVVANSLMSMYASCGSIVDAHEIFEKMPHHDLVSWTTLIMGYAQLEKGKSALELYAHMQHENLTPNTHIFVAVLKACGSLAAEEDGRVVNEQLLKLNCLKQGRAIHTQIANSGFGSDIFVSNTLVDFYVKCGSMMDACQVFEKMVHRDVVSWNTMIMGYAQMEMGELALEFYSRMQYEGFTPDARTFVAALKACSSLAVQQDDKVLGGKLSKKRCLEQGRAIHAQIRKGGFESDIFIASSLVDMYAKCGSIVDAHQVFEMMIDRDVVSWNSLIMGYSQMEMEESTLQLYDRMQQEGFIPDARTFIPTLKACGSLASLEIGKQIHAQVQKLGLGNDPFVANCLVDMYGKCGSMKDAQHVFDGLPVKSSVTWCTLIAGYSGRGESDQVFNLFNRMQQEGSDPDSIIFVSLLTVCSHNGLVGEGQMYFQAMCLEYGISPAMEHYMCMIDLLGRAGQLEEAMSMVKRMPLKPDVVTWMIILGACRKWNLVEMGRHAFNCAVILDIKCASAYAVMASIYLFGHMWEETLQIQEMRAMLKL